MNFLYSIGCYLMSLMLLNVFVFSVFFFNLSVFYIILSFCLFSVSTGQPFLLIEYKFSLWPIVLTEGFLAFGLASFHTKFSDFCS